MKLLLLLPLILVSCATKPLPQRTMIPTTPVPPMVEKPQTKPVEESIAKLTTSVGNAQRKVEVTQVAVDNWVADTEKLRDVIEAEYEVASVEAQVALDKIKAAALKAESNIEDTQAQLEAAMTTLQQTQATTSDLFLQVSSLKAEIAVQSSQIQQFRSSALTANERLTFALKERDKFSVALSASSEMEAVHKAEIRRLQKHRAWLFLGISTLTITTCGLGYLLFKP